MKSIPILFILLFFIQIVISDFQLNPNQHSHETEAKKQLLELSKDEVRYGSCWKNALLTLKGGCKELQDTDELRGKIAVLFTNCHLMKSGIEPYKCTSEMSLRQCTSSMVTSSIAFQVYTQFTTHVENVCYLIQSELFNKQTEENIQNLSKNSLMAEILLRKLNEKSMDIQTSIEISKNNQKQILHDQNEVQVKLNTIRDTEDKNFETLRTSFVGLNSLTDGLNRGIYKLSEDQKSFISRQQRFFDQNENNFKILDSSMNKNLEISNTLKQQQKGISENIQNFIFVQNKLKMSMDQSMKNGKSLLENQQKMENIQKKSSTMINNIEILTSKTNENMDTFLQHQQELIKNQHKMISLQSNSINSLERVERLSIEHMKNQNEMFEKQKSMMQNQDEFQKNLEKSNEKMIEKFDFINNSMNSLMKFANDQTERLKKTYDQIIKSEETTKEQFKKMGEYQQQFVIEVKRNFDDLLKHSIESSQRIKDTQIEFSLAYETLVRTIQKLLSMTNTLIGEFMGVETVFYFIAYIILSFLLTSTKYTIGCRIWLFSVLIFNFLCEKFIIKMSSDDYGTNNEAIHFKIWVCRNFSMFISVVILISSYWCYRDYESLNFQIMMDLKEKFEKNSQDQKKSPTPTFRFYRLPGN
eukprot:gene9318-1406_t